MSLTFCSLCAALRVIVILIAYFSPAPVPLLFKVERFGQFLKISITRPEARVPSTSLNKKVWTGICFKTWV